MVIYKMTDAEGWFTVIVNVAVREEGGEEWGREVRDRVMEGGENTTSVLVA